MFKFVKMYFWLAIMVLMHGALSLQAMNRFSGFARPIDLSTEHEKWLHAKISNYRKNEYKIVQWHSLKRMWRCLNESEIKKEKSYEIAAVKVGCLFDRPKKYVQYYEQIFSPIEIEELLCGIVHSFSENQYLKFDLMTERNNLWPHEFHEALGQIFRVPGQGVPFMLSFENDPQFYAYDQCTIIQSQKGPEGFKESAIDPRALFYQVLLTSSEYPEARREYQYWILKPSVYMPATSEWILKKKGNSLPDAVFISQAKFNVRDPRSWLNTKIQNDTLSISIDVIGYIYLNSIGLGHYFYSPPKPVVRKII